MATEKKVVGYKLPLNPEQRQGKVAQGFLTPQQDKLGQVQTIPPKRVLPIIFIPGIMGSNLRMSAERQARLKKTNNIAWRPDSTGVTLGQRNDDPTQRQLRLDPEATELDTYDPRTNSTGDAAETSDMRNANVMATMTYGGIGHLDGPLLQSDYPSAPNARTKDQKARERGWGEVYFSSYNVILAMCETCLNGAFTNGSINPYLRTAVNGINPTVWQADPSLPLKALDEKTMRTTVKDCWFPVHAMGYNWLKGNGESGRGIARRITALIKKYNAEGYACEKVILITHSMGGLVARAIIHPQIGNLNDKVLGIIHGVMPAIGAGAAYKRMRCGFEGSGISAQVLGHLGDRVTAVLGNSQGGLELLPSEAYGKDWLQVKHNGQLFKSLPQHGDPYEEIYKVRGPWFGLLREDWINPANLPTSSFESTCDLLDRARTFHRTIAITYHAQSYAHYGADAQRASWQKVVWEIDKKATISQVNLLKIVSDDAKGEMTMIDPTTVSHSPQGAIPFTVRMLDAVEAGDQTVPLHSADAQLRSKQFKGVFRQTGYEHQASYSNSAVISATVYCLFQIAATMTWSAK